MTLTNAQTVSTATVKIRFLPDDVTVMATSGESWLDVAARAGVQIATGCMAGACHACMIETSSNLAAAAENAAENTAENTAEPVLACLETVPSGVSQIEVNLLSDPTW